MSKRCMKIHTLSIAPLKGLNRLEKIKLDSKPVTGILGHNGAGKSTIRKRCWTSLIDVIDKPRVCLGSLLSTTFPKLSQTHSS